MSDESEPKAKALVWAREVVKESGATNVHVIETDPGKTHTKVRFILDSMNEWNFLCVTMRLVRDEFSVSVERHESAMWLRIEVHVENETFS